METVDGDFVVVSDPVNLNEKESVEHLFKKLIDEKVPNKKIAVSLRKNSESTDEEFKKSEKSGFQKKKDNIFINYFHRRKRIFFRKRRRVSRLKKKNQRVV